MTSSAVSCCRAAPARALPDAMPPVSRVESPSRTWPGPLVRLKPGEILERLIDDRVGREHEARHEQPQGGHDEDPRARPCPPFPVIVGHRAAAETDQHHDFDDEQTERDREIDGGVYRQDVAGRAEGVCASRRSRAHAGRRHQVVRLDEPERQSAQQSRDDRGNPCADPPASSTHEHTDDTGRDKGRR